MLTTLRHLQQDFEYHQLDKLCEVLLQLSKQSGKSLGKKDKKQQKASFRDVGARRGRNEERYECLDGGMVFGW